MTLEPQKLVSPALTEREFPHILSAFPLVAKDVKARAMGEFKKMGEGWAADITPADKRSYNKI
ncbi:hypothetical protein [Candidatus Villigracilis saccharophilus]|uniref:hypothetical protein n=1 Tax=Candidatus Villigracilis saccharophilus TaxID=3140684 RepID=UPI003136230D|nr:hypothetical protein [Anaerolineales bacterium]